MIDLIDFPVHLWREYHVTRAVSAFGIFLGSVAPEHRADLSAWRAVIATDDLRRVPKKITVVSGGLKYPVMVMPVAWETGPVYKPDDYPELPKRYVHAPPSPKSSAGSDSSMEFSGGDDMIQCSRRALQEILSSLSPEVIPPELRQILEGPKKSGEVPIQVLRDLVSNTEHRLPSMHQPEVGSRGNGAGQDLTQTGSAAQEVTRQLHRESGPIGPTSLSRQDQPGDQQRSEIQMETNIILPDPAVRSERTESSQVRRQRAGESKQTPTNVSREAGTSTTPEEHANTVNHVGGPQKIHPKKSRGASGIKDSAKETLGHEMSRSTARQTDELPKQAERVPHPITEGAKERNHNKQHKKIPVATSSHARFKGLLGQEKGRISKQKMVVNQVLQRTTLQGPVNPNYIPKRLPTNKWIRQPASQLVNVPIQQVAAPFTSPSGEATQPNIPAKRKTATLSSTSSKQVQENKRQTVQNAAKTKAKVVIENSGFVSVEVQKELCKEIGDSCGVRAGDVLRTFLTDEEDRRKQVAFTEERNNTAALLELDGQQDGSDLEEQGRFDPDSEDDLDFDEELI